MEKEALRLAAMQARDQMTEAERAQASAAICDRLWKMEAVRGAGVVFSYLAVRPEVDLTALHRRLREQGICLAFPVVGTDGGMEAWAPDGRLLLEPDRFGIPSPVISASRKVDPAEIDLILTPCVAFDGNCRRLGHGGGFYDRYFQRCPDALRICAAFEAQRLPHIPSEPWDVPMHAVVTEAGLFTI
jgi:5-formyltetrahydrofolate cyclo-ligase